MTAVDPDALRSRLGWMAAGDAMVADLAVNLTDVDLAVDTVLPGWTRAHVIAHLALGASALCNLLEWARTGIVTPMYASGAARAAAIDELARRSAADLRAELLQAQGALSSMAGDLPAAAWSHRVRTARGADVTALHVPWMRSRESWVHAADLDLGCGFDSFPASFSEALLDEVVAGWQGGGPTPSLRLRDEASGRAWTSGDGSGPIVVGGLGDLLRWAVGRSHGSGLRVVGEPDDRLPRLPPWL